MPAGKRFSAYVADVFFDSWIVPYGILAYVLADSEVQLTSKLFATLCTMLCEEHITTAACHPQINALVYRYIRTILTRLQRYVKENQKNRNKDWQHLTYAYNTHAHKFTNLTLFSLVLSRYPTGPTIVSQTNSLTTNNYFETNSRWLRLNLQRKISALQAKADTHMRRWAAQYKHHHDKNVHSKSKFVPSQWQFVDKPLSTNGKTWRTRWQQPFTTSFSHGRPASSVWLTCDCIWS